MHVTAFAPCGDVLADGWNLLPTKVRTAGRKMKTKASITMGDTVITGIHRCRGTSGHLECQSA